MQGDPATAADRATADVRKALLSSRNADGGWGYYPGKTSRIEPTAWALLALNESPGPLKHWRLQGSWRVDVTGAPVNYAFQALSGLVMLQHAEYARDASAIALSLLDIKGVRFDQTDAIRQDNSLQAWPWIDNTFSWVEPTALALLLIKKCRRGLPAAATERIAVGERMLIDRVCAGGGWNYGGSNVFGQDLLPYVPTTAWGVLALQDRPQEPAVVQSLRRLRQDAATEPSAQALALAVLALRVAGKPDPAITAALLSEATRVMTLQHNVGLALTLYALEDRTRGRAFAI
jgi:hypothetical protein